MPNGHVHATASLITAGGLFSLFYFDKLATLMTSGNIAAGALAGILISPDLDLMENGNLSLAIIRKRSRFLAQLWWLFWWPYAKIHSHRGMSHWPFIGTLVRVVYIAIPIIVITSILSLFRIRVSLYIPWLVPAFLGLCVADSVHALLDVIF